ncbi:MULTISPECIES: VOC family protein [Prauserella salsuginis group]|uniref:VOC family protein n=2 Tax=Prauserella salsuginis group TaxID=2893672 RepID=A0ABW6FX71_9PSEU|nr:MULTISPECIES: VOC family protein [Prauserella salsuginis group]MBB3662895.1 putative enzyme related to lactoylglutathione lyase [Prauserella sediminis]MCR3720591.1 hypothetical protein [Prauserella flava]MCR3733699.1 hypothetical protein [Prauserella salsuginis]
MVIRWEALTIDARDPFSLAQWWAETLGWRLTDPVPGGVEVQEPGGRAPSLFFVAVDDPKSVKNRLHLDLYAGDHEATLDGLLARGASRVSVGQPAEAEWTVLADPEGNEFCLLEPR